MRVRHTVTGWTGTLLRYERYPHVGRQATVLWDWAMFARRTNPREIETI